MRRLLSENGGLCYKGSIHAPEDREWTARMARACGAYTIDEDDEDYLDGLRSCFNCRYRRWLADGFSCAKQFPSREGRM